MNIELEKQHSIICVNCGKNIAENDSTEYELKLLKNGVAEISAIVKICGDCSLDTNIMLRSVIQRTWMFFDHKAIL